MTTDNFTTKTAETQDGTTKFVLQYAETFNQGKTQGEQPRATTEIDFTRELSFEEFTEPQPHRTWMIDGLFAEGGLYLLVGDPGSGKTWTAMDMAMCIAKGKPWLDTYQTTQGPVLIVDEESSDYDLKDRIHRVWNGHTMNATEPLPPLTALPSNGVDFGNPKWETALSMKIREKAAKFVVIDALVDVSPGRNENDAQEMQGVLQAIRRVAHTTGATILVIHHNGKSGQYRGSSSIKGAVDGMLNVKKNPDDTYIEFETEKERHVKRQKFAADFNYVDATKQVWLSARDQRESATKKVSRAAKHILTYLLNNPEDGWVERMKETAEICKPSSIPSKVYELVDEGYITKAETGPHNSSRYVLTETGETAAQLLN